jgi:hypothetical protein
MKGRAAPASRIAGTRVLAALAAGTLALSACRGVLGIDDGRPLLADADESGAPDATASSSADGNIGAMNADGATAGKDAANPVVDAGGGGIVDASDDGFDANRPVWGTIHIELPGGPVIDWTDQYYGDCTVQPSDVLVRIQTDKGYAIWSVMIPSSATPGNLPFARYADPTIVGVSISDNALGANKGAWSGTGTLTLTAFSTTSGGDIAGTFTGTLTFDNDTSKTAPFHGQFEAHPP